MDSRSLKIIYNVIARFKMSSKTYFFVSFTASKDLAQTSYFMATNRLLSCSHSCTVMAHYSFLFCRVPLPVSNALRAAWTLGTPGCWEVPARLLCAVYCTRAQCWHKGVECTVWSVVVLFTSQGCLVRSAHV
ncbi:hypothetical protein GOODEAATRI_018929 [Goodea atripinnis]|uniref:Uncharacterized protein n=1 Tax=Goodea atripinnis TaxID=208336 RepID=A0ABV0PZL6_9TELE